MTSTKRILTLLSLATLCGLANLRANAAPNDQELLKQMEQAKLTWSKAIETAEAAAKGKAIAVRAKLVDNQGTLVVDCVVNGKCMDVPVVIATGKAGKIVESGATEHKHVAKAAEILKALDDAKMTLAKAITAAEESSKAKALSVTPKLENGTLDLVVYCLSSDKGYNVTVDAKTGKVTQSKEVPPKDKPHEKKPEPKKP